MTSMTKRIPVTEPVWKQLAEMRSAGQTYDELLAEMIEIRKKHRLAEEMERIDKEDDYIPISEIKA